MLAFEYSPNAQRVVFGSGSLTKLPAEIERLKILKPLMLSTPGRKGQAEEAIKMLGGKVAGSFNGAVMHTPTPVTERALAYAQEVEADGVVSVGGGSVIGLGKAISLRTGLPHICVPTTYSGSEATSVVGETTDGKKTTTLDKRVLPSCVIYDVDLTLSLPRETSAYSGVNALAHAVEALYAEKVNPIVSLLALEGAKALAQSLPEVVHDPTSVEARSQALYGAWLCGLSLAQVNMALHHKLCHVLGGSFGLPHAETHTIVLRHSLSYNAPAVPKAMQALAGVLPGSDGDAAKGLNVLLKRLGVKTALKDLGMKEDDISKAAEIAMTSAYWNPRKLEQEKLREVIRRAWAGEDARADL